MTIIAYDPKTRVIGCDSLATQEGRKTYVKKYRVLKDGRVVIIAGTLTWLGRIARLIEKNQPITGSMLDAAVAVVYYPRRGLCYAYDDDLKPRRITTPEAWGDGDAYAIGAMAAGASVPEALRIACKHHNSCGGKIHTFGME